MRHLEPQLVRASADRAERRLEVARQRRDREDAEFWRQIRDQFRVVPS